MAGRQFARAVPRSTRVVAGGLTTLTGAALLTTTTVSAEEVDYAAVRKTIAGILDVDDFDDGSLGPILLRLAWHSSGTYSVVDKTGGSNGATMRFAPEANHGANAGLHIARNVLEPVKAKHPGISYADLYTLAGVVAIEEMGGPKLDWSPGRTDDSDGKKCTPDGRLPDAAQGAQHLRDIFYRQGFNDQEIVALAGAHTFGRCHTDRSGFKGPWTRAPTTFSNLFYQEVLNNRWTPKRWDGPMQYEDPTGDLMMLPTDLAIRDDPEFRKWAEIYAKDEGRFAADFSSACSKLFANGVDFPSKGYTSKILIASLATLAISAGAALPWSK